MVIWYIWCRYNRHVAGASGGDTVYLMNEAGVQISSCYRRGSDIPVIETASKNHPKHLIFLRSIAMCCYMRLLFLSLMLAAGCLDAPAEFMDCFLVGMILDFSSRYCICMWLQVICSHAAPHALPLCRGVFVPQTPLSVAQRPCGQAGPTVRCAQCSGRPTSRTGDCCGVHHISNDHLCRGC